MTEQVTKELYFTHRMNSLEELSRQELSEMIIQLELSLMDLADSVLDITHPQMAFMNIGDTLLQLSPVALYLLELLDYPREFSCLWEFLKDDEN